MAAPLLEVEDLTVRFTTRAGEVTVLDNVSFTLRAGERISFVGESGCGKSMTALAVMGLLPAMGQVCGGAIRFKGEDLVTVGEARMRQIRGNEISMIFQEPMTSLNPLFTIGRQIAEVLQLHRGLDRAAARARAVELLEAVRIPNAAARVNDYPHQLSGGQRQRVMIAIALACEPEILIADEPTTALDVTVQAEIFALLRDLGAKLQTAIILITHDMGAVAQMAERMLVMYAGRRVEEGRVADIVRAPAHPYTHGLISCVPHISSAPHVRKAAGDCRNRAANHQFRSRYMPVRAALFARRAGLQKRKAAADAGHRSRRPFGDLPASARQGDGQWLIRSQCPGG